MGVAKAVDRGRRHRADPPGACGDRRQPRLRLGHRLSHGGHRREASQERVGPRRTCVVEGSIPPPARGRDGHGRRHSGEHRQVARARRARRGAPGWAPRGGQAARAPLPVAVGAPLRLRACGHPQPSPDRSAGGARRRRLVRLRRRRLPPWRALARSPQHPHSAAVASTADPTPRASALRGRRAHLAERGPRAGR